MSITDLSFLCIVGALFAESMVRIYIEILGDYMDKWVKPFSCTFCLGFYYYLMFWMLVMGLPSVETALFLVSIPIGGRYAYLVGTVLESLETGRMLNVFIDNVTEEKKSDG